MSDSIWKLMVDVQMARRDRDREPEVVTHRKRPSTLRSVRELLVDDHYAILAAGKY